MVLPRRPWGAASSGGEPAHNTHATQFTIQRTTRRRGDAAAAATNTQPNQLRASPQARKAQRHGALVRLEALHLSHVLNAWAEHP
jgi:hypothetical protein